MYFGYSPESKQVKQAPVLIISLNKLTSNIGKNTNKMYFCPRLKIAQTIEIH